MRIRIEPSAIQRWSLCIAWRFETQWFERKPQLLPTRHRWIVPWRAALQGKLPLLLSRSLEFPRLRQILTKDWRIRSSVARSIIVGLRNVQLQPVSMLHNLLPPYHVVEASFAELLGTPVRPRKNNAVLQVYNTKVESPIIWGLIPQSHGPQALPLCLAQQLVNCGFKPMDTRKVLFTSLTHLLHQELGLRFINTKIQTRCYTSCPCSAPLISGHEVDSRASIDECPLVLTKVQQCLCPCSQHLTQLLRPLKASASHIRTGAFGSCQCMTVVGAICKKKHLLPLIALGCAVRLLAKMPCSMLASIGPGFESLNLWSWFLTLEDSPICLRDLKAFRFCAVQRATVSAQHKAMPGCPRLGTHMGFT
mmetsp:Transcript_80969/g.156317  ORF Transcript_80969/g.156317 Transcript_80969/m.156317 type:complete len:364 (+) Transcript_80969:1322-2413(+)